MPHTPTPPRGHPLGARGAPARRFTLIELLVAMTLMTILTGSVVFIFIQAQNIFTGMDAKVQVYQYARYAFDQMERDLSNVVNSRSMEFFNDRPSLGLRGHYEPGEEIPIRGTANRDGDPFQGDAIFNYGFTLRQPAPYTDVLRGEEHRRDSVYFKTVTVVGGETATALVEYALVDTDRERPRLIKRLWRITGVDAANPLNPSLEVNDDAQALPHEQNLCLYTTDAVFEVFVRNRRRHHPGDFYEAGQLVDPPRDQNNRPVFEGNKNYWAGQDIMVQGFYDVDHDDTKVNGKPTPQPDFGVFQRSEDGLFRTRSHFTFPMLREGDTIYMWQVSGTGFRPRPYTIKAFYRRDRTQPWDGTAPVEDFRIEFEESIDYSGDQVEVRYAAGWVPPALRATLKIKDARSLEDRTVSRVFKILSD